jgi:mannan endo-1,4-beta-mannosidase
MIETATNSIKGLILGLIAVLSPVTGVATDGMSSMANIILPQSQQCISLTGPILKVGSESLEVKELQRILNMMPETRVASSGPGSPGNETTFFGRYTETSVKAFQTKYAIEILIPADLTMATGLAGLYTRAKVRGICEAVKTAGLSQADLDAGLYNGFFKSKKLSGGGGGSSSSRTTESPVTTVPASTTATSVKTAGVCATVVNTCTAGTFSDKTDSSTQNIWSCLGISGGATVSCSLPKTTTATTSTNTNTTSVEWGVFNGYSTSELTSFETLVGKQAKLRSIFTNWGDAFPTSVGANLKSSNKTLVIFWEQYGVTLDSIIAGEQDAYIKKFATDAKAYGGPVFLAPFHEMNGNWDPWGGTVGSNTPKKVVDAWKHIHDVFGTVSNVKWAWAMNNLSVPNTSANAIAAYYPGDAYVDIVAVDGFNFGSPWESFDTVFSKALTTVAVYKKSIYILSIASAQGTQKAGWITDAFTVQVKKYPLLKGWVWFNENKEKDWRVDSDPASLSAFKAVLQ